MRGTPILALVAALALGLASGTARAEDERAPKDPAFLMYEAAAKKILKSAGNKVWEAAEYAKRSGLHQFAYEQANRALKFDPDQKDAREHLGYVKNRGKQWVLDEDDAQKVLKQNQKSEKESQASFDKKIEKWREERLAKANRYVAAKYAQLGDEMVKKKFPLQAIKGYEASLRVDPDNAKARKGLGYKKFGKVWLTAKQDQARKDAAKGTEVKEESEWDDLFGETMNKAQSEHFRLESFLPAKEQIEILFALETCYAYYLADLGFDPTADVFRRRARFCLMKDGEQWNKWVDRYGGRDKEFTRKLSGTGAGGLNFGHRQKAESTPALRKDSTMHQAVHMLNRVVWGFDGGAWINEGLAYYYTVKVQETCLTHCVAIKRGDYARPGMEGGLKDWKDPANWKPNVKTLVQQKNDIPLRTMVLKRITELEFDATIKAWSVISWMMDTDRDRFIELLTELKTNRNQIAVLEGLYGKGLEEIDEEWQRYVLRNY